MSTGSERDGSKGLMQLLSGSRQGRVLTNHLASVSVKLSNSTFDSSMRQCASMRRCVLDALRKKDRASPFGLPKELPKTIVVANIAGDHIMLYDNNNSYSLLYQFLNVITPPGQRHCVRSGIDVMIAFASEKTNRTLLFVYCMPPLEEPCHMHWELRSVTSDGDKVLDGARHFARNATEPCCGTSTGETTEPTLLRAETAALQNHVVAVSVDVGSEATADTSGAAGVDGSTRETVLRNTIAALQTDRNRILGEINTMRNEQVQNIEKEKITARKDVEREIDAARTAKRLADKQKADSSNEMSKLQKELALARSELNECLRAKAHMELTHAQEKEGLKRTRAIHDKEKRDLKASKERSDKQFNDTIRSTKTELENLRFDSQARIRQMEADSEEFRRKERMNKDMHDRVVACMAGQDAELEVLRSKVKECQVEVDASREVAQQATLDTDLANATIAALKKEAEAAVDAKEEVESRATLAVVMQMSAAMVELQGKLEEEQRKNAALNEALVAGETKSSTRAVQTATTCMATVGTDTYIDTAQRSRTTQTDPEEIIHEPINVVDASKRVFAALEQLFSVAQLPQSEYVAQSGVHPPARRFSISKRASR